MFVCTITESSTIAMKAAGSADVFIHRQPGANETVIEVSCWSLALAAQMFVCTITEDSTIAMKAINQNSKSWIHPPSPARQGHSRPVDAEEPSWLPVHFAHQWVEARS